MRKLTDSVEIRLLRADEIECRIGTINEKGLSLLLFKDARIDQKLLDELFTPFGWKRSHQVIDGNLYCTVEVWDDKKQMWISKQDVGTKSDYEKEKGQASDSFKRACFNWGIGRELYTAPFIWIPADKVRLQQRSGKYTTTDCYHVTDILYSENREIVCLKIRNDRGIEVFSMDKRGKTETPERVVRKQGAKPGLPEQKADPRKEIRQLLDNRFSLEWERNLEQELERTGVEMSAVLKRYQIQKLSEMTPEMYRDALNGLRKTKSKAA